jgi:ABC-type lipoprotein release transport system permease subunit
MITQGHYLEQPTDAVLGSTMALNLGARPGDEVVIIGSAVDGGVAALSLVVAGIIDTGTTELDRALIQVPLAAFQDAFDLGDRAHVVVARVKDFAHVGDDVPGIDAALARFGSNLAVLPWQRLMPELVQVTQLKAASSDIMFVLIAFLVTFSVFNAFMMTVFERTREFGMLLAIGMRPGGIVGLLQLEAAWLAVLGAAIGVAVGSVLIAIVARVGIPVGDIAGEMLRRYHMPDRIYPELDTATLYVAPLLMLLATQFAALIPSLRIRTLMPVDALRSGA